MTDAPHLSQHHRTTLEHLTAHPTSHNIEWHDVIDLLREVADVREEHDGKFVVELGEERLVLTKPHHKDVSEQQVLDVRHLLARAGIA